jgi:hypothetical protein
VIDVQLMTPLIQALQAGSLPNLDALQLGPEASSGMSELFGQLLAEFKAMENTNDTGIVELQGVSGTNSDSTQALTGIMNRGVSLNELIMHVNTTKGESESKAGNGKMIPAVETSETIEAAMLLPQAEYDPGAMGVTTASVDSVKPNGVERFNGAEIKSLKKLEKGGLIPLGPGSSIEGNGASESATSTKGNVVSGLAPSAKGSAVAKLATSTKGDAVSGMANSSKGNAVSELASLQKGAAESEAGPPRTGVSSLVSGTDLKSEFAPSRSAGLIGERSNEVRLNSNGPIIRTTTQSESGSNPVEAAVKSVVDTKIVSPNRSQVAETVGPTTSKAGELKNVHLVQIDVSEKPLNPRGEPGGAQIASETTKMAAHKPFSQVFRPHGIPNQLSAQLSSVDVKFEQIAENKPATQAAIAKSSSGDEAAKVSQFIPQGVSGLARHEMTKVVEKQVKPNPDETPLKLSLGVDSTNGKPPLFRTNLISEAAFNSMTQSTPPNGLAETAGNTVQFSLMPGELETGTTIKQELQVDGRTIKIVESKVDQFGDTAVKQIRYMKDGNEQSIRIRLIPRSLGEIQIQVKAHMDSIEVVMTPSHAGAREAIEMQMAGLREKLSSEGIEITQITVQTESSSTHQRDHSFSRQSELNKQSEDGSKREHSPGQDFKGPKESSQPKAEWVSQDGRLNLVV